VGVKKVYMSEKHTRVRAQSEQRPLSEVRRWTKKRRGQWVIFPDLVQCFEFPSVLWHCWLGDRRTSGL